MAKFKGFDLFNDIEDKALQARNRATIMANMSEDFKGADSKISATGALLIFGYFQSIPEVERYSVAKAYAQEMTKRGFAIAE